MAEFGCNQKGEQVVVQYLSRMFDNKVNQDVNRRPTHCCENNEQTMAQPQRENNSKSRKSLEIKQTLEEIKRGYKVLVLMRGLPGAGKSTLAKSILRSTIGYDEVTARNHILSTDDYFMKFGTYQYDPRKLSEAHGWNHQRANRSMSQGFSPVIIDNTNLAMWEMKPYAIMATDYGYIVRIIEPDTHWCFDVNELSRRNNHNVPKSTLKNMLEKYEKNLTPSKLLAAYDCKYERQRPPQFRMHPRLESAPPPESDFDKTKQSSVDDILLQNGDTSFLKTPVLKPVQQSLSLFDNISAWGVDEAALRSWDIVVPLEPIEPAAIVLNNSDEEAAVETCEFSTETTEEDFDLLGQIESDLPLKDVKVLVGRHREINVNYQPEPRRIVKKLMIDRSCNTEESHEAHLESLERVFPNVSPKTIHYWYRKCNQDFSWTMELLLAEAEETINVTIEQAEVEEMEAPLPQPIATASTDSSSSDESKGVKKKMHKKRSRHFSHESESLKKSIESKVTIADAHYSDRVLKVKQLRFGHSEPNPPTTSSEEIDTDTDNNEPPASPMESETIELNLGDQLVKQLEETFGDLNLLYPKGFQPVVQMPTNIARQLFTFYIESVYQQMDAQKAVMEDLVKEDEEFARKLQDMEYGIDGAPKPDPTDIPDIVREQRELSKRQKEAEKWKENTPDTLAAKLTREKLFRLFPSLDRNALLEILHAHDNVYKDTVETLIASTGLCSQMDLDNVIKLPIEPEVMMEMREAHDDCKQQGPELEETCSAIDYREKANQYLQKRTELYEKAYRHYRNGSREVAQFYGGLATQQTRLFDQANGLAATAFLDEHSKRLENFNTLDLHFLYVKEAIPHLDIYLDRLINLARSSHSKRMESIQIITGRGKNSANGVARIRPAVIARLKERKLWYMQLNPGLLKAKVGSNSLLTIEL